MRLDWLTLRYALPTEVPIPSEVSWPELGLVEGRVERDGQVVLYLRNSHKQLALVATGGFFAAPRDLALWPEEQRDPYGWLGRIHDRLCAELGPVALSCARADYAEDVSGGRERAAELAELLVAGWPSVEREPCVSKVESMSGVTFYVGVAGTDPGRARERSPFVRVYTTHKRPGMVRVEVECKHLDGDTLHAQICAAQHEARAVFRACGLGEVALEASGFSLRPVGATRRRATTAESFARVCGMVAGTLFRERRELSDDGKRALWVVGRALGLDEVRSRGIVRRALRRHERFVVAGGELAPPWADEVQDVLSQFAKTEE